MHPLIAAFLDVRSAADVLKRASGGGALSPVEQAFARAAQEHDELAAHLDVPADKRPSEDAQNATILLGVRAAVSTLPGDETLGPAARAARAALEAAGADPQQIEQLLGGVLVEEAFTGDADPTQFDITFVEESLRELLELAKLDDDSVTGLGDAFVEQLNADQRPLAIAVVDTLFNSAWGDGTQSVNVEHVEDALGLLASQGAELEPVKKTLELTLRFLSAHRLIGPLRLQRLLDHLAQWTPGKTGNDEEDDDEEDD